MVNDTLMDICQKIARGDLRLTKTQVAPLVKDQSLLDKLLVMGAGRFAWHIVNQTWTEPTCHHCGGMVTFRNHRREYAKYCSKVCTYADPARQNKIQQTMMARYGVDNAAHHPELIAKKRETMLTNWGVEHPTQSADIRDRIKATVREKWGVDNISQSQSIKDKKLETNRDHWGVDWVTQSAEVRSLMQHTNLERYGSTSSLGNADVRLRGTQTMLHKYGAASPQQVPEIRERTLETNLERYGHRYPTQNEEVKKRIAETNLQRYGASRWWSCAAGRAALEQIHLAKRGVINPSEDPAVIDKIRRTNLDRYGVPHLNYHGMDAAAISALTDPDTFRSSVAGLTVKKAANKLGVNESTIYRISRDLGCRDIMDLRHNSYESKITDLLDVIGIRYETHDRKIIAPNELDIYIPDHRLAVEVGSIYWHGEKFGRRPDYHLNKWQACRSVGVRLFQWFDDDLDRCWHLTSSRLMRALGIRSQVIGARKVHIGTCSADEERSFLDTWHAKGHTNARDHVIAARYDDQIVAIMSIKNNGSGVIIERWATDVTRSWPGLFSRCLAWWTKQVNFTGSISSWCDNRLGDGGVYRAAGFNQQKISKPGYWYFKDRGLENRQRYQKHRLKKLFDLSDEDLRSSEFEIMKSQGYDRIWDAGHTLWMKTVC